MDIEDDDEEDENSGTTIGIFCASDQNITNLRNNQQIEIIKQIQLLIGNKKSS